MTPKGFSEKRKNFYKGIIKVYYIRCKIERKRRLSIKLGINSSNSPKKQQQSFIPGAGSTDHSEDSSLSLQLALPIASASESSLESSQESTVVESSEITPQNPSSETSAQNSSIDLEFSTQSTNTGFEEPSDVDHLLDERIKIADLNRNAHKAGTFPVYDNNGKNIRYNPWEYHFRMRKIRAAKPKRKQVFRVPRKLLIPQSIHLMGITRLRDPCNSISSYINNSKHHKKVQSRFGPRASKPKVKFNQEVEVCYYPTDPLLDHYQVKNNGPKPKRKSYKRAHFCNDSVKPQFQTVHTTKTFSVKEFCESWIDLVNEYKVKNPSKDPLKGILKKTF